MAAEGGGGGGGDNALAAFLDRVKRIPLHRVEAALKELQRRKVSWTSIPPWAQVLFAEPQNERVCARVNHVKGLGCLLGGTMCESVHACLLCGSTKHGMFFTKSEGTGGEQELTLLSRWKCKMVGRMMLSYVQTVWSAQPPALPEFNIVDQYLQVRVKEALGLSTWVIAKSEPSAPLPPPAVEPPFVPPRPVLPVAPSPTSHPVDPLPTHPTSPPVDEDREALSADEESTPEWMEEEYHVSRQGPHPGSPLVSGPSTPVPVPPPSTCATCATSPPPLTAPLNPHTSAPSSALVRIDLGSTAAYISFKWDEESCVTSSWSEHTWTFRGKHVVLSTQRDVMVEAFELPGAPGNSHLLSARLSSIQRHLDIEAILAVETSHGLPLAAFIPNLAVQHTRYAIVARPVVAESLTLAQFVHSRAAMLRVDATGCALARQVCEAVVNAVLACHALGYAHGNLTPDNVILVGHTRPERLCVKLTDFKYGGSSASPWELGGNNAVFGGAWYENYLIAQASSCGPILMAQVDVWCMGSLFFHVWSCGGRLHEVVRGGPWACASWNTRAALGRMLAKASTRFPSELHVRGTGTWIADAIIQSLLAPVDQRTEENLGVHPAWWDDETWVEFVSRFAESAALEEASQNLAPETLPLPVDADARVGGDPWRWIKSLRNDVVHLDKASQGMSRSQRIEAHVRAAVERNGRLVLALWKEREKCGWMVVRRPAGGGGVRFLF